MFDNKMNLSDDDKVRKLWSKYLDTKRNDCEVGAKLTVIATGYHRMSHATMYLCKDSNGNPVLIDENGLDTDTDLKINDIHLRKIAELEKENIDLKERLLKVENAYKRKSEAEWQLTELYQKLLTDFANTEKCSREYFIQYRTMLDRYIKAKDIILNLYNAGRDVLMCRTEEKAYDNLSEAINDRSIEQFLEGSSYV
jgi:hypothetical protein